VTCQIRLASCESVTSVLHTKCMPLMVTLTYKIKLLITGLSAEHGSILFVICLLEFKYDFFGLLVSLPRYLLFG
jgi:hypothetical protein